MAFTVGAPVRLVVRAAKHVNPKATKHHTKTRPKKVRPRSTVAHAQPILSKWALNPETRGVKGESARDHRKPPDLAPFAPRSLARVAET